MILARSILQYTILKFTGTELKYRSYLCQHFVVVFFFNSKNLFYSIQIGFFFKEGQRSQFTTELQ